MAELNPKDFDWEDELDLKAVMSNPRRWFPVYFLLLLIGIVGAGYRFLDQINDINKNRINSLVYYEPKEPEDEFMVELAVEKKIEAGQADEEAFMAIKNELKNSSVKSTLMPVTHCVKRMVTGLKNNKKWKSDYSAFKTMVLTSIPHNGFNSNVTELSDGELRTIHGELANIIN